MWRNSSLSLARYKPYLVERTERGREIHTQVSAECAALLSESSARHQASLKIFSLDLFPYSSTTGVSVYRNNPLLGSCKEICKESQTPPSVRQFKCPPLSVASIAALFRVPPACILKARISMSRAPVFRDRTLTGKRCFDLGFASE